MHELMLTGFAVGLASSAGAAPVQVQVTGTSNADGTLIQDIVRHIALFGPAFKCSAPSSLEPSVIPRSSIPASADYKADSDLAGYEDWKADFCGKTAEFLVTYWPDPNGGSFLKVTYPYPTGAPHGGQ